MPTDRPGRPIPPAPAAATGAAAAGAGAAVALACAFAAALAPTTGAAAWRGGVDGGVDLGDGTGTRVHAWLAEDARPLTHRLDADWIRRADAGDAWSIGYVPRRHFARRAYAFAETRLGAEAALGIDSEARALLGLGATLSPTPAARLFAELGAGAVRVDPEGPCEGAGGAAPGDRCAGDAGDEARTSALGTLRAGASATLAERLGLSAAAGLEAREGATDLGASATASLAAPGGTASVTVRTRRLARDGEGARSVTDTFVGYSLGF